MEGECPTADDGEAPSTTATLLEEEENDEVEVVGIQASRDDDLSSSSSSSSSSFRIRTHLLPRPRMGKDEQVLRLSASCLGGICGLNPFTSILDLVEQHIYQDLPDLHLSDLQALGLQVVDEEQQVRQLIAKTGAEASKAIQQAHRLAETAAVQTVQDVSNLKKTVDDTIKKAQAEKRLTAIEARVIRERTQQMVNREIGNRHEEHALSVYEQRRGCEVFSRNNRFLSWDFPLDPSLIRTPENLKQGWDKKPSWKRKREVEEIVQSLGAEMEEGRTVEEETLLVCFYPESRCVVGGCRAMGGDEGCAVGVKDAVRRAAKRTRMDVCCITRSEASYARSMAQRLQLDYQEEQMVVKTGATVTAHKTTIIHLVHEKATIATTTTEECRANDEACMVIEADGHQGTITAMGSCLSVACEALPKGDDVPDGATPPLPFNGSANHEGKEVCEIVINSSTDLMKDEEGHICEADSSNSGGGATSTTTTESSCPTSTNNNESNSILPTDLPPSLTNGHKGDQEDDGMLQKIDAPLKSMPEGPDGVVHLLPLDQEASTEPASLPHPPPIDNALTTSPDLQAGRSISINHASCRVRSPHNYFKIVGFVDGMCEEIDPETSTSETWAFRPVVVEVKMRMRRTTAPPLYDQIQLISYMLMLGCTVGDLIEYVKEGRGRGVNLEDRVSITRINLHTSSDGGPSPQEAWYTYIIPRLYQWVDLVYHLRSNDDARLSFLLSDDHAKAAFINDHLPYFGSAHHMALRPRALVEVLATPKDDHTRIVHSDSVDSSSSSSSSNINAVCDTNQEPGDGSTSTSPVVPMVSSPPPPPVAVQEGVSLTPSRPPTRKLSSSEKRRRSKRGGGVGSPGVGSPSPGKQRSIREFFR